MNLRLPNSFQFAWLITRMVFRRQEAMECDFQGNVLSRWRLGQPGAAGCGSANCQAGCGNHLWRAGNRGCRQAISSLPKDLAAYPVRWVVPPTVRKDCREQRSQRRLTRESSAGQWGPVLAASFPSVVEAMAAQEVAACSKSTLTPASSQCCCEVRQIGSGGERPRNAIGERCRQR
jgi:hypothetical protein